MLVEDDPSMRNLLKILLELEGFQIVLCADTRKNAVMETLFKELPDAILMDVNLSGANGLDILGVIRQQPEVSATRILMCSGLDLHYECMNAGADGFLLKPYMPDDLISWLRSQPA
jgi:two-component system phosphate regulon response regulator PhoB